MPKPAFVHLHLHTQYSLLDGSIRLDELAEQAHRFKMPAAAITDHGNLFGVVPFYRAMQKHGVKPILGIETYVSPGKLSEKTEGPGTGENNYHLTLLAATNQGYKNLIKLSSIAYLEGFYYKPRIDKDTLARHSDGIIGLSGCWSGEIASALLKKDTETARAALRSYMGIFGAENFYIEVQNLGLSETEEMMKRSVELAAQEGVGLVATNDCHFLHKHDAEAHDVLLAIQTGKKVDEVDRMRFESAEMYFKSAEEMVKAFPDLPEAIENTLRIAERCMVSLDLDTRDFKLPRYPIPAEFDSSMAYLKELAYEGCRKKRLEGESYKRRLEHELHIIEKMGFAGYFLIVKDIVDYARKTGVPVGPGRGSAVGSLVLYALGITSLDPIHYGLIFERFLNPDRITLPDIDIDFADEDRDNVISYIHERYGEENVTRIITFDTMKAKAAVRDVGRALDIPYGEVDRLAKLIPFTANLSQARKITELSDMIKSNPAYERLFDIAEKLEGVSRHASIHASGVVITPEPLTEFVPLYKAADGGISTQYDMKVIDSIGLLKMDILGLRTLSVIKMSEELINSGSGNTPIDTNILPLDDRKTFELLQRADTAGLFQLESRGMRDILKKLKPTELEDIIAVIAIYRPGPLANIDLDEFFRRKNGEGQITYLHPKLEPVLAGTHGMLIYQEQVMQAARAIAGFSYVQADHLRRAMGKKIPELMNKMKEEFFEGAKKHGVPEKTTQGVYDLIAPFSGYGFNKSHSAGYGHISYTTAYLKANYPLEFFTALLTNEMGHSETKMSVFINNAREYGFSILPPDVNRSGYAFRIENGAIRFGLGAIKNVGRGAAELIEQEAGKLPFRDFRDFLARTKGTVNRKCAEFLIRAGCFDEFDPDRELLIAHLQDEISRLADKRGLLLEKQTGLFGNGAPEQRSEMRRKKNLEPRDFLNYEKDAFGFYLSGHPLEEYRDLYEALEITTTEEIDERDDGKTVAVAGAVTARKGKRDKKGRDYAILTLRDFTGEIDVFVFSKLYEQHRSILRSDEPVIVKGRVAMSEDDDRAKLFSEEIIPFSAARARLKAVIIDIQEDGITRKELEDLYTLIAQYPGRCALYINILNGGNGSDRTRIRSQEIKVSPTQELVERLKQTPSIRRVRLHGTV
ncbi:DNA polymerase III subunit alpha [candidate division WOR-3 bacterium]|nr:DNA polymerase III subunit alpha [candidate division WOR-3 bacterium]